tara:strand:+ start:3195 stop:4247 length:1053 start_codon:yes stop_codon:yes gene_type:complete
MPDSKNRFEDIKFFLRENSIKFDTDFNLSKKSWLKAGGQFKLYIQPNNLQSLKICINYFKEINIKFYVVGNLSNIIFRDGEIYTPIINLKNMDNIEVLSLQGENIEINAFSGLSIFKLANYVSYNLGICGLEGLVGIPGSLGGGIYMNASSYESYISEFITEVKVIDENSNVFDLKKNDIFFEWRSSIFHRKKNLLIVSAKFKFPKKNKVEKKAIDKNIKKVKEHRFYFQEKNKPNLGSLFATKNLYEDIKNVNMIFKILNLLNNLITRIIVKFFGSKMLVNYRKYITKIYAIFLGVNKNSGFKISERTINCLVNVGSENSNQAIQLIKKMQKKINYTQKLENIIIENIE